jgi:hypothetical protein
VAPGCARERRSIDGSCSPANHKSESPFTFNSVRLHGRLVAGDAELRGHVAVLLRALGRGDEQPHGQAPYLDALARAPGLREERELGPRGVPHRVGLDVRSERSALPVRRAHAHREPEDAHHGQPSAFGCGSSSTFTTSTR